jgi:hypothetical protein
MCPRCSLRQKWKDYPYCQDCKRAGDRARAAARKAKRGSLGRPGSDACNCKNPVCNGLMCDRLSTLRPPGAAYVRAPLNTISNTGHS